MTVVVRESKALLLSLPGWILLSAACGTGAHRAPIVETPVRPMAPQSVAAVPVGPTAADVMSTPVVVDPAGGLPDSDTRVNQDLTTTFQNETAIASDPADPMHLVAAWNDNTIFDPNFNLQK